MATTAGASESWNTITAWTEPLSIQIPAKCCHRSPAELFAPLLNVEDYQRAIYSDGFYKTYAQLFGDPWLNDPTTFIPGDLQQPELALPFALGKTWTFTGGPHAAWGNENLLAALDLLLQPPLEVARQVINMWSRLLTGRSCYPNRRWSYSILMAMVTNEPAGSCSTCTWARTKKFALYAGSNGDPIGHPSCEGGSATGTHVHIARKYNGEWIPASGDTPLYPEGWVAAKDLRSI